MLTPQQGQIEEALRRGGLGADAATEAATAIASCAIGLIHRAFLSLDYTPKAFRFITPQSRKFQFPGVDAPMGNPDYRPPSIPLSEGLPTTDPYPKEPQDPRPPFGPTEDPSAPPEHPSPNGGGDGMGPLRQFRVVSDVRWNKQKKRLDISYSEIWAYYGGPLTTVELKCPTVKVVTDLRVSAANKLYGDTVKVGVISLGEVQKGDIVIEGVACDSTTNTTDPNAPGYVPGGA